MRRRAAWSAEQAAHGKIDVDLRGQKLRGGFTFVRAGRSADSANRERWLLVKHRDGYADPSWKIEASELDYSVLTGRRLREIGGAHLAEAMCLAVRGAQRSSLRWPATCASRFPRLRAVASSTSLGCRDPSGPVSVPGP